MGKIRNLSKKKKIFIILAIVVFVFISGFLIRVEVMSGAKEVCPGSNLSQCSLAVESKEITLWDRIFNYSGWFDSVLYNRSDCPLCFIFEGE